MTLAYLKKLGIFSSKDAHKAGISSSTLYRWIKDGDIQRLGRGRFIHSKANISHNDLEFAEACSQFGPKSTIAGLTALYHYGLIEEVPEQTWLLVPADRKTQSSRYRLLRARTNFKDGIEDRGHYRIVSVERAVIDAIKYAKKFGERIAIQSARAAIIQKKTTPQKLGDMAKKLGLYKVFATYWEAITV